MIGLPPAPTYFHKPVSALNAHDAAVVRPAGCKWLNYEGEIAIIIGRTARNVSPEEAGDYIRGYSVGNDYGLHDFRDTDSGSMLRVKGADTLCPIGPGVVEGWTSAASRSRPASTASSRDGNTDEMEGTWTTRRRHRPDDHLQPGDILMSGTPAISRTVYPGDVVEVEVEGLGTLRNHIVEGPTPIRTDVGAQPTETEEVLSTAQGGLGVPRDPQAAAPGPLMSALDVVGDTDWVALAADVVAGRTPGMPSGLVIDGAPRPARSGATRAIVSPRDGHACRAAVGRSR